MRKMMAASAAACIAFAAHADTMNLNIVSCESIEGIGAFTGTMNWSYSGGKQGYLTVSLTNTSSFPGGQLTGFGFNADPTKINVSLMSGLPAWDFIQDFPASPYENFDYGAAVNGDFLGGGNPAPGIDIGSTGTFVFKVMGASALLSTLDAMSFFDESKYGYAFIARFRGFDNGGSDKVIGCLEPNAVPVPMPVALAAAGLLAVGVLRRRMK
jgi:hypothetical protein